MIKESLSAHGILLLGSFPFNQTDSFGDHLDDSVRQKDEIKNWIFKNFESINIKECKNIFRKKNFK